MPIALMAIFALPTTLSISLISGLNSIKKLKGLNREEKRRIDTIANGKIRRQIFLIATYLLVSVAIGLLFFVAALPVVAPFLKQVLAVIGAAIAFAIMCSIFSIMDTSELANFEAKITNRSTERKAKQALLKRLATKD
jgi:amino acid transporter